MTTVANRTGRTGHLTTRVIDLDVVRAVALIGVAAMNFHGYLIVRGSEVGDSLVNRVFNPWTGPLSTRFAATFVLVAGMGVTLLTNRSRLGTDRWARSTDRWILIRRGVALYAFGYVLDWIWSGTILFFYGALFLVASALFTLRIRWLIAIGATSSLAAAGIQWWAFERAAGGHDTAWLLGPSFRSPRGLVFDTFVNGTHPLLPWLTFLCAGMVLGRLLPLSGRWRVGLAAGGAVLVAFTYTLDHVASDTPLSTVLVSTHPFDRSLIYTVGTLGSSVTAFCLIGWLAQRSRHSMVTRALAATGCTTLTLYVLHVLVFNLVVDWHHWVRPAGLDTALAFAGVFWVTAVVAATLWQRLVGMGPLERVYRRFGGERPA